MPGYDMRRQDYDPIGKPRTCQPTLTRRRSVAALAMEPGTDRPAVPAADGEAVKVLSFQKKIPIRT